MKSFKDYLAQTIDEANEVERLEAQYHAAIKAGHYTGDLRRGLVQAKFKSKNKLMLSITDPQVVWTSKNGAQSKSPYNIITVSKYDSNGEEITKVYLQEYKPSTGSTKGDLNYAKYDTVYSLTFHQFTKQFFPNEHLKVSNLILHEK